MQAERLLPVWTYRGVDPDRSDMATASDAVAFSDFFDANFADVWRYVRRRVPSAADADELTAEAFTTTWRRFAERPAASEMRLWLFGVARNVLENHRRTAFRRQRLTERLQSVRQANATTDWLASHNSTRSRWTHLRRLDRPDSTH